MTQLLDNREVEPEVKTAFFMMGYCLFKLQELETSLRAVLSVPFAPSDLDSEDAEHRSKTFGQLLSTLRARVEVDADLANLLKVVLGDRNFFVHHLTSHMNPQTLAGLTEIATFCQTLVIQAREAAKYLNAALLSASPGATFDGADAREVRDISDFVHTLMRPK